MIKDNLKNDPATKSICYGILLISIFASLMHFLYDLSGKLTLIAAIAPVNESVWEHLKLAFLPTILWWTISYFILRKRIKLSLSRWFTSFVVALVICPLFIVIFFYTYTGAFGFKSLFLDISSLYVGITIAQLIALRIYKYARLNKYHTYIAAFIFILFTISFITFTFIPPHLPLFRDSSSGTYGINK